ncbi:restriction endonuclease [soil metagenome]
MAVPDFQSIMLPLTQMMSDGREYSLSDMTDALGNTFDLSQEDRIERIPSGRQTRFYNRVCWSTTHLKKAAIIENTRRGVFRITERGKELLKSNVNRIDLPLLGTFPEYIEFKNLSRNRKSPAIPAADQIENVETPEELLDDSYQSIRAALKSEILESVKSCSPAFFERLVVELLVKMGYGGTLQDAGEALGRSGDGGIDGIIKEDRLGLDIIYLQAKRWENTVPGKEIREFAGVLQWKRAKKGVFITTSDYSKSAREFAGNIDTKIILIGGEELAELMIDYGVGVSVVTNYEIKRIDSDYFIEV